MSRRPLKIPGHRPLSRPEDRDRPFSLERRDPRLGPAARCLSRGPGRRGGGGSSQPQVREVVVAREVALRRLRRTAENHAEARQPLAEVRRELVDVLLHLRAHSLEVVESIERWRSNGNRAGAAWIDPSSGENYLLKMKNDTLWLVDNPLGEILTFSPKSDPFFVVPSAPEGIAQSPTNQMTPTLQAKRQQDGKQRRTVLPLQSSMLQRIHKAEMVILKESVQARMNAVPSNDTGASRTEPAATNAANAGPSTVAARAEASGVADKAAVTKSQPPPPQLPRDKLATEEAPGTRRASSLIFSQPQPSGRTPEPAEAPPPEFTLWPMAATETSVLGLLDRYLARVDPRVLPCLESRSSVESLLQGDECRGAEALEFFWLFQASRADANASASSAGAAETADGLAIFRLKKGGACTGTLVHLSVASQGQDMDKAAFQSAVVAVKSWMFAWLPIRSIRVTLWYTKQPDGSFGPLAELAAAFKDNFFKWFQLTNTPDGRRGQVLNRPRVSLENGASLGVFDPETPEDTPGLRICWGQLWLRGAGMPQAAATQNAGSCAWNLIVAAVCFHHMWSRDAAEVAKNCQWDAEAAQRAQSEVRDGLVQALLQGSLHRLLSQFTPSAMAEVAPDPLEGGAGGRYLSEATSAGLARHLANKLEATGLIVPPAFCEATAEGPDKTVERLIAEPTFSQNMVGLSSLPGLVVAMRPRDIAFGGIKLNFDWHSVFASDAQTLQVSVTAAGKCPWHPHPVCYSPTTEDDVFAVIIPWAGVAQVPTEEAAFAACTEILRGIKPLDPLPFSSLRLTGLSAAAPVRTTDISDARNLGFSGSDKSLHVSEFGSLLVSAGRQMPGRLPQVPAVGSAAPPLVERPFILGFWHTALDSLNVPLAATLVS